MRPQALAASLLSLLLALTTGCSSLSDALTSPSRWLGDSSEALGDSSQGSADSSDAFSRSSSSDDESESDDEARYRNDVRLTAARWAERAEPAAALGREVAAVAARYGVADWQTLSATWRGLEAGLQAAGLEAEEIDGVLDALGRKAARAQERRDASS